MNELPPLNIPTPVLSLVVSANKLWAGGVNGLARYASQQSTWHKSDLSITRVAALLQGDGWLLAGGPEGIARSSDDGEHWQAAAIESDFTPITCFAVSSATLLAGTLSGILRSTDSGLTWNAVTDLQDTEIAALCCESTQRVLAATNQGIFRSTDDGATWQATEGTDGQSILAIGLISDERLLALPDAGGTLISTDGGLTWQPDLLALPDAADGAALHRTARGSLLLSTSAGQLYRSDDQGQMWTLVSDAFVFAFTEADGQLWAGTTAGVLTSTDDGLTWQALPLPPIHDLSRLVITPNHIYVAGEFTGLAHYDDAAHQWELLDETPVPLTLLHTAPNGRLFASGPDGLAISDDHGATWPIVMRGFLGHISYLALDQANFGQAATITSRYLLRTLDGGQVWQGANSPFGNLVVIGLEINVGQPILVTYDPTTYRAQLCRSTDQGESWECSNELPVQSAHAATYPDPLLVSLDDRILRLSKDGNWQMTRLTVDNPSEPLLIRKFVGNDNLIAALTTHGLYLSSDRGEAWQPSPLTFEADQLLDIAIAANQLYVLTSDGVKIVPLG